MARLIWLEKILSTKQLNNRTKMLSKTLFLIFLIYSVWIVLFVCLSMDAFIC